MKKRIVFLLSIFLLSAGVLFAALPTAEATVSLKTTSDKNQYEVGFASKPVSNYDIAPDNFAADYVLSLEAAPDGAYASMPQGTDVYVYWKFYTLQPVEIKLRARGALYNETHNHALPWTISWAYDGQPVKSYAESVWQPESSGGASMIEPVYQNVAVSPKRISLMGNAGSTKLTIKTNSLLNPYPEEAIPSPCYTTGVYKGFIDLLVVVK